MKKILLLLENLKFWNTINIGIPARSLQQVRQTSNWSFKPKVLKLFNEI